MSDILENIYNFFSYIKNLISEIGTLFSKVIGLLEIVKDYVISVIHVLPAYMWAILGVLVAVCIIYKILGREGNA